MAFTKRGELMEISPSDIQSPADVVPLISEEVISEFKKIAVQLKRIAPKADDFLYFSCIMMNAAEAALINEDGTPKLNAKGEPISANWDKSNGTWRWVCSDSNVRAYKNSNGDIFPAEELIKAHKKWIGKPLCIDHKSSSVDHVRGFIVDTYYDHPKKRVIALCALDKANYPELARKVATGYSNSVSMGTAVGRAICYDCGKVARTEADFCKCMRGRSCYGEINVDLNPIELSIVVNGADPQAKIKHIIAAAKTLNDYVDTKEKELKKLADFKFTIDLGLHDPSGNEGKSGNVHLESNSLDQLKSDVEKAFKDFERISHPEEEKSEENTNLTAFNQSGSSVAMNESDLEATDLSLAPPSGSRFASSEIEDLNKQLSLIKAGIENKLNKMQQDLDKLTNTSNSNYKKEEIMSGSKNNNINKQSYYQGGGGVNEPTPGQVKYPIDPLQDEVRETGDKQMVGQPPFPEVGPVDGMHPSPASVDPSNELERKKMLARAQADERAMQRQAAVNRAKVTLENRKQAYFQGGGGVNEPTPHKVKYPIDPMQDDLRDNSDKQMVGQKPFPEVGKIDGLHPSPESADQKDELKRKELLLRAGLQAKFIKGAWEVYDGDKLVLTASVEDIAQGRSDLYSSIATKEFAKTLLNNVRTLGVAKVASLYKKAQAVETPPAGASLPAPDMTGGAASPDASADKGADGDPKVPVLELAEKVRDLSSDLVEGVRALTGEQAELGEVGENMPADDSGSSDQVSMASLNNMRKELNSSLLVAMKEAVAALNDHEHELNHLVSMYNKGAVNEVNKDFVKSLAEDCMTEAKQAVADSFKLLGAFVKYARGSEHLVKRAQEEALTSKAHGDDMVPGHKENEELMGLLNDHMDSDYAKDTSSSSDADDLDVDALLASDADDLDADADGTDTNDVVMVPDAQTAAAVTKENPGASVEVKHASENETREMRALARAKLAAEVKWMPIFDEFHPKGNATPGGFDVKVSDQLNVVENLEEKHEKMMDVMNTPPKVRKEAEMIQQLVSEGKLNPEDLPALVANGVDPDAVKYWKQFYGEAGPEGSEFASELVKEHVKAQLEEQMDTYRVKIARAYDLAYEMRDRELIPNTRQALSNQVDEIMKWNDESFEGVKKLIAKSAPVMQKNAGQMPQVGIIGTGDTRSASNESEDLVSQLTAAFSAHQKDTFNL